METEISVGLEGTPTIISRVPLGPQTNSTSPRSPASETKRIRRKSSFIRKIDSSEEYPSPHESLFEAEYASNPPTASEDSEEKAASWPTFPIPPQQSKTHSVNNSVQNENAMDKNLLPAGTTPIIYGRGTHLTTIVEHRSSLSMRTSTSTVSRSNSASDPSSLYATSNLLNHRDSFDLPRSEELRSPRRLQSFSTNDVELIKQAYHDACTSIEQETRSSIEVGEIYAQPRKPIHPPFDRPDTPPGMPSWTAAQLLPLSEPSRLRWSARTQARLRCLLRTSPENLEISSQIPPQIRARRFRVPRSSHGLGPTQTHPFLRDISLTVKGVGETPSPDPDHPLHVPPPRYRRRFQGPRHLLGKRRPGQTIASSPLRSVLYHETTEYDYSSPVVNRQTRCMHRRAQYQDQLPPGYAFLSPTAATPIMDSPPPISRYLSSHSRAQLLTTVTQPTCWRCRVQHRLRQMDHCWEVSARWCCWWCCGVDIDEVQEEAERPHVVVVSPGAGSIGSVSMPIGKVSTIRRGSGRATSPLGMAI